MKSMTWNKKKVMGYKRTEDTENNVFGAELLEKSRTGQ